MDTDSQSERKASDEHVLAEMTHELGNFFHRLYYWSEYLRDVDKGNTGDQPAGEMLERTIKHLEGFLKVGLEYFAPVELNPVRMTTDDILNSFTVQLSTLIGGTPLEISRDESVDVLVDLGRISQTIEIAVRRVVHAVGEASRVRVETRRAGDADLPGVELRVTIEHPTKESPFFRSAKSGVEWAIAQKLVQLHGGSILQHEGREEGGFTMFFPASGRAGEQSTATGERCD